MQIEVNVVITRDMATVWELWTTPQHIVHWNFAHESWMCPTASNDLRVGGEFNYRMEARDQSMGFDFAGTYLEVIAHEKIVYTLGCRSVTVLFTAHADSTVIKQIFDADDAHSIEQQRNGWQAILNNFKHYAETLVK